MAAITQVGTSLKIGFTGNTITSLIMEDVGTDATGVQDIILDENAATTTVLVSDLGSRVSFSAIVETAYSGDLPPAQGSLITIGTTVYRVETASFKQTRKQSILTVAGIREASMAATYDT